MEKKRKLPARSTRAEPAGKRRASKSPDRRQSSTPAATAPPPPPPPIAATLPTKLEPNKPLPTVDEPQSDNLSSTEFQSISESGVLAESIHRSRQKWISEGIFEKYWTKPVKKKGSTDPPPNNPDIKTMQKLGTCVITVEPHSFDAIMWQVKEDNPTPVQTPTSHQAMYRPILQYGPPNGMLPPPMPTPPPPQHKQFTPQPTPQASPRMQDTVMKNTSPAPAPKPVQTSAPFAGTSASPQTPNPALPNPANPPNQPQTTPATSVDSAPTDKSKDPVIQMLAERASTDADLKALMRIVANGQATKDQLQRFQSHIDDLTLLQKSREASTQPSPKPPNSQQAAPAQVAHQVNQAPPPNPRPVSTPVPAVRAAPTPPPTNNPFSQQNTQFQSQPQALRSKGPVPSAKSDITKVLLEFTGQGSSGDRFAFPRFSILEYQQNQVIASFLIVRRGSTSEYPRYDPQLDYYQPVTIRLYAHQGRQLEALQKVVAPQDEVREYMNTIMDKATRAEYVLLAMRLPKESDAPPQVEKLAPAEPHHTPELLWATTNNTPPIANKVVKPPKKPVFEQDNYQSFINSVSSSTT
ncbi:hypothetical protein GLAREA_04319 [Glarea lozoyensis ATCC 20868]|uniref:SWR1-complex protein 3 domain-containing protein n=1 Tax=Glarea lozoyensis (strain ATCC 20868 / MF5171) TaxID=1116229 RepID=S3DLX1_GLAL2|nr:uncharacterized protein GLAREA_04319 [Glarea lozoyensis ATCC 20868]EPE27528.1 hypothetical protein GLAREA_04319 [Glarea lozoyensis ATCC 20868]